jgi:hypothetical protein
MGGPAAQTLPEVLGYVRPSNAVDGSISQASIEHCLAEHDARPSDVIVSTFPKTGTTVLMWLCHLLRSDCDTAFEDLYQVAPWLICAWDLGQDLSVDGCQWSPRLYKSHLRLASEIRGCKYLVTIRDPLKTTQSFYNFMLSKGAPQATGRTCSEFLRQSHYVRGSADGSRASLWDFFSEYWLARDCDSVLVVVYEDLVKDMRAYAKLIAHFMGVPVSDALVDRACAMSTKEAMAQHDDKMNETWVYNRVTALRRSPDVQDWKPASRIAATHNHDMDQDGLDFLDKQWRARVETRTGMRSYTDMATYFRQKNALRLWQYESSSAASGASKSPKARGGAAQAWPS